MGSQADVQPLSGDMGESLGSERLWEGRTKDHTEVVNLEYTQCSKNKHHKCLFIHVYVISHVYYIHILKV